MRMAHERGHRVVLVLATRGEHGEVPEGFLGPDETLGDRRAKEQEAAAEVLGIDRVAYLGYVDSGMMGTAENGLPGAFWNADIDEAAGRLAAILREEGASVLTVYDDNGGYGHPDHIQVHRVGLRAGELASTPKVYQVTMNRDDVLRGMAELADQAGDLGFEVPDVTEDPAFGKPESMLTARVDVSPFVSHKRRAMRAHASQISESSFFLKLPDEMFARVFGVEWYIREGQGPGITETDLFAGLSR